MAAKYLIRLDDASEFMNNDRWEPFFKLFDKFNIHPIIAVIPFNRDAKLINNLPNLEFWDDVRYWQDKGYIIALHGYEHVYKTRNSGIIGKNPRSEFAGVAYAEQKKMLEKSINKFNKEKIKTNIFVAPAHSFDKNTLKALTEVTNIKYISDGYYLNIINKNGINWIPQQLWEPRKKSEGVWTICLHPETSNDNDLMVLEKFLEHYAPNVTSPFNIETKALTLKDLMFSIYHKSKNILHSLIYK